MAAYPCKSEYHETLTLNPEAFRRHTTPLGIQKDGAGGALLLGACKRCRSTLSREIEVRP